MKKLALFITLLFLNQMTLAKGHLPCNEGVKRSECEKEWTVLIYMAADNDLSPYALWDLHEMETKIEGELNMGTSTEKVDVLVELDTVEATGITRYHMIQQDRFYQSDLGFDDFDHLGQSFIQSPILSHFGENEFSSKERLKNFLKWGVLNYPAKKVLVVIWGHGEGFTLEDTSNYEVRINEGEGQYEDKVGDNHSRFFDDSLFSELGFSDLPAAQKFPYKKNFGGVAFDYSEGDFLNMSDIREALHSIGGVDVMSFDACLMQNLEVATEIIDETEFILASNQIQSYLGLPYRKVFDYLNTNPSAYELSLKAPLLTKESWDVGGYQYQIDDSAFETFSMASLSTAQLKAGVYEHLNKVSIYLLRYLKEEGRSLRKQEVLFLLENAPRFQGETLDLGLFYGLLEELLWLEERELGYSTTQAVALKQAITGAQKSLQSIVMEAEFGPLYYTGFSAKDFILGHFSGLSIWLPRTGQRFESRKVEYQKSMLYQSLNSWQELLSKLYQEESFSLFDF